MSWWKTTFQGSSRRWVWDSISWARSTLSSSTAPYQVRSHLLACVCPRFCYRPHPLLRVQLCLWTTRGRQSPLKTSWALFSSMQTALWGSCWGMVSRRELSVSSISQRGFWSALKGFFMSSKLFCRSAALAHLSFCVSVDTWRHSCDRAPNFYVWSATYLELNKNPLSAGGAVTCQHSTAESFHELFRGGDHARVWYSTSVPSWEKSPPLE